MIKASPLRVALGEYDTGWHDPAGSLERAASVIRAARDAGADLVVLPEMCTTGFTMEPETYAEPIDGPSVQRLSQLARESRIRIIAGVATRARGRYYNSSLLIDPDGAIAAEYRKQRLFAYASEHECYTPGDVHVVVPLRGINVGLFICFDLRFPELFREAAPEVDAIVIVANWPARRQSHWETLLRARAIESQAYVVGVNRIGEGGGLTYAGGSFVFEPWGEVVASGAGAIATIDRDIVTSARTKFPLIEDRRAKPV